MAFAFLLVALVLARCDQGVIPAIATGLKRDFQMSTFKVGTLGSMTYLGATVGSLLAIPLLDQVPSKWALFLCLVGEAISLFVFTYAQDFTHLSLGRFFSGAC